MLNPGTDSAGICFVFCFWAHCWCFTGVSAHCTQGLLLAAVFWESSLLHAEHVLSSLRALSSLLRGTLPVRDRMRGFHLALTNMSSHPYHAKVLTPGQTSRSWVRTTKKCHSQQATEVEAVKGCSDYLLCSLPFANSNEKKSRGKSAHTDLSKKAKMSKLHLE